MSRIIPTIFLATLVTLAAIVIADQPRMLRDCAGYTLLDAIEAHGMTTTWNACGR